MPTVLRWGPYRAFFYSNEGSEPPHVHLRAEGREQMRDFPRMKLAILFGI